MYEIKADVFAKIAAFRSTEETRCYLNGVYLHARKDVAGIIAVATDGYRMGVWRDDTGAAPANGGGVIVGADKALLAACKPAKRENGTRYLVVDVDKKKTAAIFLRHGGRDPILLASFPADIVDGVFPDYSRIVPPASAFKDSVICINPALLDAFSAVSERGQNALTLQTTGTDGPILIRAAGDSCRDFFGVLMPMRGAAAAYPAWWTETAGATPAERAA